MFSSDSWDFWTFDGNAGGNISLGVLRQEINHDPIMAIWFGLESDTSAYSNLFSNSTKSTFVGVFDDNIVDLFGGPWGEPLANIILPNTGTYTVAVADHTFDGIDCIGECDYSIQLSYSTASVPEPPSLALIELGLVGIGFSRKKKSA